MDRLFTSILITALIILSGNLVAQGCEGSLGPNLFAAGDFGSGVPFALTNDPGYAPGYAYVSDGPPNDGQYIITNDMAKWSFQFGTWLVWQDNSSDPNGYMMVINASFEPGLFYEEKVENLCDNTVFDFSADIINLIRTGTANHSDPNIDFLIDDEVVLRTGNIPKNQRWNTFSFLFETAPGQTSVKLSLRNNAPGGSGNDLGLDNISFRACGPLGEVTTSRDNYTCIEDLPITLIALLDSVENPNARYQWEERDGDSSPWNIIPNANESRLIVRSVDIGTKSYRFASAGSPESYENEKCRFYSDPMNLITPRREFDRNDTLCGGTSITLGMQDVSNPGQYMLELVASTGCDSIINVDVDTVKRAVLTGDLSIANPSCFGLSDGRAEITNITGGFPPYNIVVNDTHYPGLIADDLFSGFHELQAKDRYGCFFEDDLTLNDPSQFTINLGPDQELILGDLLEIEIESSLPISEVTWSDEFSNFNDQVAVSILPIEGGIITADAIDINGCEDSDTLSITIDREVNIYTPNAFSPNGDNINDDYYISTYGRSLSHISKFSLYDRWGNELWGFDNENNTLTPQEQILSNEVVTQLGLLPGVYTFKISAVLIDNSAVERVGTVNLIL